MSAPDVLCNCRIASWASTVVLRSNNVPYHCVTRFSSSWSIVIRRWYTSDIPSTTLKLDVHWANRRVARSLLIIDDNFARSVYYSVFVLVQMLRNERWSWVLWYKHVACHLAWNFTPADIWYASALVSFWVRWRSVSMVILLSLYSTLVRLPCLISRKTWSKKLQYSTNFGHPVACLCSSYSCNDTGSPKSG